MKYLLLLALLASPAAAELSAAASAVDITPDPQASSVWMAGFGTGRKANSVHDPICSRAVVISDGRTKIALVSLDLVGLMRPHVLQIRKEAGQAVDYLMVASTHNHEGPDTMGMWGESPLGSGLDPNYMNRLVGAVSAQVETLASNLRPATLRAAQAEAPVPKFVRDSRDPVVIDNALSVFQLMGSDGRAIATVVNWANHPETLWNDNVELSADYPGALCRRLEEVHGGTGIFFSGALGGMMTPEVEEKDGHRQHTFEEAERIGRGIADRATEALKGATAAEGVAVSFEVKELLLAVANRKFHLAMGLKVMERDVYSKDGKPFEGKITTKNVPYLKTEVGVITVGPVTMCLVPGELFPEFAVGGYDGSKSFGKELTGKDNEDPPDLDKAPQGPYLRDRMNAPCEMIIGLANDELGYLIPEYDFKANMKSPTLEPRPPGDHYEETNSLGKSAGRKVVEALEGLLK